MGIREGNSPGANGVNREQDLAAYDQLHPKARAVLQDAPFNAGAVSLTKGFRRYAGEDMASRISDWINDTIRGQTRQFWGPDHPQVNEPRYRPVRCVRKSLVDKRVDKQRRTV